MSVGWEYKKLGEVCEIYDSQRKPVTKSNRKRGEYPYYGATGIQDYVDSYIFDGRYLLIGEDGAKWGAMENSAYIIEGKSWVNNHAHIIKPTRETIDTYLMYFLNYSDLDRFISGAIVRKLTQASLKEITIPLPLLPIQQSIVAELDEINNLLSLKRKELETYDKLAQSLFYEMFGDPVENEKGWEVKKLGEICEFYNGKAHENAIDENGKYLLINSKFIASEAEIVKKTNEQLFPLYENDITMVMSDVPNGRALAKCFLVRDDDIYTLNQRICAFRNYSLNEIYFFKVLNRNGYFLRFNDGNGQTNLRKNDILNCPIPIPPLPLQQLFATRIEAIEAQKANVKVAIEKLETLLAARMQYWFD